MGKIGLFGGTFDPPHTAHIAIAEKVLAEFSLNKVIFIPAGNPPHKTDKKITDKSHRFKMVELAVGYNPRFLVSDFDVMRAHPNYSYQTIEHFKKQYPDDEIFFIVGADSYRDFPLWKNYPEILSLCTFIVVNRPDVDYDGCFLKYKQTSPDHKALIVSDFSCDLSSTDLRKDVLQNKNLLPRGVKDYIKANNLYSKESL